jgi:hypothetical protein
MRETQAIESIKSDETSSHIITDCKALTCRRLLLLGAITGLKTVMDRMDF